MYTDRDQIQDMLLTVCGLLPFVLEKKNFLIRCDGLKLYVLVFTQPVWKDI